MIINLLKLIVEKLKTELNGIIDHNSDNIVIFPFNNLQETEPSISLIPARLTIQQHFPNNNYDLTTITDFQQDLLIFITNKDLTKLEQSASVVTAIILTNQAEFRQQYNNLNPKDDQSAPNKHNSHNNYPLTKYQSKNVSNTHFLNQISFLEQTYIKQKDYYKIQLKFVIYGQLKMVKNVSLSDAEVIKEVEIENWT